MEPVAAPSGCSPDMADLHLTDVLHALAGPLAQARDDQRQAVHSLVVDRRRVLVVQATGGGSPPCTGRPRRRYGPAALG